VDFRAATFEADLIHEVIDEVDAATVILIQVLALSGVRKADGVETGPRVTDYDQHTSILFKHYGTLHELGGITGAAMLDGVGKRLS
jgi:hypothetical protein